MALHASATTARIRHQHASREADEAIAAATEDVIKAAKDGDDGAAGQVTGTRKRPTI